MTLSLVLPCYNEEPNIAATVRDCVQWMRSEKLTGEIIAVDDGSRDGTVKILEQMRKDIPELRIVRHEKNQGYGLAVRTGCDAATCEYIAFMDSDGQFHASDISRLLHHLQQYSFVTGRRRRRADPLLRRVFGKILGAMNYVVLGIWVRDVNCGMKVFHRDIWPRIRPEYGVEKLFNTEMFLRLKRQSIPWQTIDVPHYPRTLGAQTGGSPRVIARMFWELWRLKKAKH